MNFLAKRAAPTQACLVTRRALGSGTAGGFFVRPGFADFSAAGLRGAFLAALVLAWFFGFLTAVSVVCSDFVVMIVVS
jgi:hypothetical protein